MSELDLETGTPRTDVEPGPPTAHIRAVDHATQRLLEVADGLDESAARTASLLPGWTRAHVLTHLARNADALVNLLTWARTGVEHPMYASKEDRDADIHKGAARHLRLILEDLAAAAGRFGHAVRTMPSDGWAAEVASATGKRIPAPEIPRMRLLEVWVHLADLDHGVTFDDIPQDDLEGLINDGVRQFAGRADLPSLSLRTDFDDGRSSEWQLGNGDSPAHEVRGRLGAVLGWLLGRTGPERLTGNPPDLPRWL